MLVVNNQVTLSHAFAPRVDADGFTHTILPLFERNLFLVTDEEFEDMLGLLEDVRFDHLGAFEMQQHREDSGVEALLQLRRRPDDLRPALRFPLSPEQFRGEAGRPMGSTKWLGSTNLS